MRDHANRLNARGGWVTPLSLFATVLIVFVTADFRTAFFIPAAVWHALFLLGGGASFVWLIVSLQHRWNVRKQNPEQEFITDVRGDADE